MSQSQGAYLARRISTKVTMPRISEHEEQANFITEVKYRFGGREDFVETLLFSVPNGAWFGGKNPQAMYNKFKAEGLRKGVSDLLYLQPRGEYAYLAIEMKAKGGSLTSEQEAFLEAVNANGGTGECCVGCEEAIHVFSWYMGLEAR